MKKYLIILSWLTTLIITSACISTAWAADSMPKFDVTLTDKVDKDEAVGKKDEFTKTTPMIYLIANSDEVTKGQKIKATWIAVDTKNVAPANYKIDEKELEVTENLGDSKVWTANYSLSKPDAGWPVGTYRVDLKVDGKLAKSVDFSIK